MLHYNGEYWPDSIESCLDEGTLAWIEERLYFMPLSPRISGYDVLADTHINPANAKALAEATDAVWEAIMKKDILDFGKQFCKSFEAQTAMLPNMLNDEVLKTIKENKASVLGWKLSGAGGGGYLVFVSENEIPETLKIRIRR